MPDVRPALLCWRRIDELVGLELLALRRHADGVQIESSVICAWEGGYRLDHAWDLTPDWRTRSLRITRWDARGQRTLTFARDGERWRVDGVHRPDLDGAEEPDVSITPLCNTLPMRRTPDGGSLNLDTAWVNGDDLTITRSRQRYEHRGPGLYRYIDLGVSAGFEADLRVDDEKLVLHYEHLFERIETG